jgi:hypothetical protein
LVIVRPVAPGTGGSSGRVVWLAATSTEHTVITEAAFSAEIDSESFLGNKKLLPVISMA